MSIKNKETVMEVKVMEVLGGELISKAIDDAIASAKASGCHVRFDFNGASITVAADSRPDLIGREFSRRMAGCIDASIGPYPASELTVEEQASDARIHQENARRAEESAAAYRRKQEAQREACDAKLANDRGIELADADAWATVKEKNTDPYGAATVSYTERWARLMQVAIASGQTVEQCAEAASHEADVEGITGFMYGCAVGILAKCWKHGEALRRWHNLKSQIGNEGERANAAGGVLNPALLNIGER